jgi:hypothetical protein
MQDAPAFTRRGVLAGVVVATGAGLAPEAVAALRPESGSSLHVYDRRFAEARDLAAGRGDPTHAIDGDVTALWTGTLEPALRAGLAIVTGLTDAHAQHCLALMARREGLALVERRPLPSGLVAWRLARPEAIRPRGVLA